MKKIEVWLQPHFLYIYLIYIIYFKGDFYFNIVWLIHAGGASRDKSHRFWHPQTHSLSSTVKSYFYGYP